MEDEYVVDILPDGSVKYIYTDNLNGMLEIGNPHIKRASHVEPGPDSKWYVDLSPSGGPSNLNPNGYEKREDALKAEHDWLVNNLYGINIQNNKSVKWYVYHDKENDKIIVQDYEMFELKPIYTHELYECANEFAMQYKSKECVNHLEQTSYKLQM